MQIVTCVHCDHMFRFDAEGRSQVSPVATIRLEWESFVTYYLQCPKCKRSLSAEVEEEEIDSCLHTHDQAQFSRSSLLMGS